MNRHPFRFGSAVFGLLFAGIAAAWTVRELALVDADTAGLLVAALLIVLGVLGIIATVVLSRRPQLPATPVEPTVPDPTGTTADHGDERVETEADEAAGEEETDGHEEAPTQR